MVVSAHTPPTATTVEYKNDVAEPPLPETPPPPVHTCGPCRVRGPVRGPLSDYGCGSRCDRVACGPCPYRGPDRRGRGSYYGSVGRTYPCKMADANTLATLCTHHGCQGLRERVEHACSGSKHVYRTWGVSGSKRTVWVQ